MPYLLVAPGMPSLLGELRLRVRAAPTWEAGAGQLSLKETGEMTGGHFCSCPQEHPWASGNWVSPYTGDRTFQGTQKKGARAPRSPKLQRWHLHGSLCLLAAKDSLVSPEKERESSLWSTHPNSLPSSSWEEKGLRVAIRGCGYKRLWLEALVHSRAGISLGLVRLGGVRAKPGVLG